MSVETPNQPRYVSSGFLAKRNGVTTRTIKSWVDAGVLKVAFRTVGGQFRFVHPDDEAAPSNQPAEPAGAIFG